MIIHVKVIPNAPQTELRGTMADGTMKIALHAPREGGKANDALRKFLSRHFSCPVERVLILRGTTLSKKMVRIE